LYRASGNQAGEASALNNSGYAHILLGDPQRGRVNCLRALTIHQHLGNVNGQANAWHSIGLAEHHLGNLARAVESYRHADGLYRDIGRRDRVAGTLNHLGDVLAAAGDREGARDAWQRALEILQDMDHSDAAGVRAKLRPRGGFVQGRSLPGLRTAQMCVILSPAMPNPSSARVRGRPRDPRDVRGRH
jgi:tetratricopeptide (TPR) repeat protein